MNNLLRLGKFFILLTAFSLLTGCGSRLTPENLDKVQNQMTTAEVKKILGNPTDVKTSGFAGLTSTVYVYKKGKTEVTVTFVNDKVMFKDGTFQK